MNLPHGFMGIQGTFLFSYGQNTKFHPKYLQLQGFSRDEKGLREARTAGWFTGSARGDDGCRPGKTTEYSKSRTKVCHPLRKLHERKGICLLIKHKTQAGNGTDEAIVPRSLVKTLNPWRKDSKETEQIQTLPLETVDSFGRLEALRARYLPTALALLKVH